MVLLGFSSGALHAALIDIDGASNEFSDYSGQGGSNGNPDPWGPSADTDGDVTLSILNNAVDGGNTGMSWNNSWSSGSYVVGAEINTMQSQSAGSTDISANAAEAFSENRFLTIQLSTVGSEISWDSIGVTLWRNGDGAPEFYQFAYDDEGIGFDTGDFLGSSTALSTGIGGIDTVSFSAPGLPTSVASSDTVRLYFWGGTSGTGNFHITEVEAGFTVIPEPSTFSLVILFGLFFALPRLMRRRA